MTEEITLQTSTGAVNNPDKHGEPDGPDGHGNGSGQDTLQQPDAGRLLEPGVALHVVSEDEEGDTDKDCAREMTEEEVATAKAVLDDPSYDQEGLALTGGGWFNTIKKATLDSKMTEKELAARMKQAKI